MYITLGKTYTNECNICNYTMLKSVRHLFFHCKVVAGIWSVLVFLSTAVNSHDSTYNLDLPGLPDHSDSFIKYSIIWTYAPLLFRYIPLIFNTSPSEFYLPNLVFPSNKTMSNNKTQFFLLKSFLFIYFVLCFA